MASIRVRKKADGTESFLVRWYDPHATERESTITLPTKVEAETLKRILDENGQSFRAAEPIFNSGTLAGPTVQEAVKHHIEQLTGVEEYTIAKYEAMVKNHFSTGIGRMKVKAIKPTDITRWLKMLESTVNRRGKPYSAKTISNIHGLLSGALNTAMQEGHIDRNPCKGVRLPKGKTAWDDSAMINYEDWLRIRAHMRPRYHPFGDFLVGTGLRFSEATALKAKNFDLDGIPRTAFSIGKPPEVRVSSAHKQGVKSGGRYVGAPKTRKGARTVTLAPSTVAIMRPLVEAAGDGYVFKTMHGGPFSYSSWYQHAWDPARKAANLDKHVTTHSLRHLHASMMLAGGMDIHLLSRRLGHEQIAITLDLYSHLLPDANWATYDVATKALEAAVPPEVQATVTHLPEIEAS